jgi:putative spermidine/putrescine transport system permease protein
VTSVARPAHRWWVALALTPFLLFCALFELVPIGFLLAGSLNARPGFTTEYLANILTQPTFRSAVVNSLVVSTASSLIGAALGTVLGYALFSTAHRRLRRGLIALANISANSGGVSLGFAFVTVLGATGAVTVLLRTLGIDLYSFFSLYTTTGLVIVYVYFQVPLMVVLMLPAFVGLRADWREASDSLGGAQLDYWRRIGIPTLLPSIAASTVLLFASAMGAYATVIALIGSRANLMTVQVAILRQGEVVFNPSQSDAMAVALLAFVALSVAAYHLIQRRTQRWIAPHR